MLKVTERIRDPLDLCLARVRLVPEGNDVADRVAVRGR
jgi:hypothetical protein